MVSGPFTKSHTDLNYKMAGEQVTNHNIPARQWSVKLFTSRGLMRYHAMAEDTKLLPEMDGPDRMVDAVLTRSLICSAMPGSREK